MELILKFEQFDKILIIPQVAYNKYTRFFSIQVKVIFSQILHKNVVILFSYLSLQCVPFCHKRKHNILGSWLYVRLRHVICYEYICYRAVHQTLLDEFNFCSYQELSYSGLLRIE